VIGLLVGGGPLPPEHPLGAEDVLRCARFRPARGFVGRWQGHQHECAPPPASGAGGVGVVGQGALLCHQSTHLVWTRAVWRNAGHVLARRCLERLQQAEYPHELRGTKPICLGLRLGLSHLHYSLTTCHTT
jgi:hypothetical protein